MKDIKYFAEKAGMTLTEDQYMKFLTYEEMLLEWNKKINLTAITLPEEIALKHFTDSISVIPYLMKKMDIQKNPPDISMIDIGTGAGFPGIPIKIMCPEINLTLLDSLKKRINFLDEVIKVLKLDKCVMIHGRAEDCAKNKNYAGRFDIAIARAVSKMPVLCEYCLPFVKVGGIFAAMKSNVNEEIESAEYAIRLLGGKIEECHRFFLPECNISRSIVIIRKTAGTPAAYPRKAGRPEKEPLMKPERKDV